MKGSIVKRGKKYSVVVELGRDPVTRKRQQKWHGGFATKKQAEQACIQLVHSLQAGTYVEPTRLNTGEFLIQWLERYARPNVSIKTFVRYEEIIKGRLIRDLGSIPLPKLKPSHILEAYARWGDERRPNGMKLSAQSILHHHRVLREALGHALKWQVLAVNPASAVDPPRVERRRMATLDVDQARALLTAADSDKELGGLIALTLWTGLRLGEVSGLHWSDIDFTRTAASVRFTVQKIKGYGTIIKEPKTRRSVRVISLPRQAVDILHRTRQAQIAQRLSLGIPFDKQGLVFTNALGEPIDPQCVRRHYRQLLRAAGLPCIRFHDLRHTHATLMLSQGIHPKVVSERLGHATVGITLDTYSHVLPNLQAEAAQKLDALLTAVG